MRKITPLLALVALVGLTHCGSEKKTEATEGPETGSTTDAPAQTTLDLATARARLSSLEADLITLPGEPQDMTVQLTENDELGNLWKAPTVGYPGWSSDSAFVMGLTNFFQDSQNLALYHAQGRTNTEAGTKKWVGSVQIASSHRIPDPADPAVLQGVSLGKYQLVENEGRRDQYTYQGLVLAYFTFDAQSESVVKTPSEQLPTHTPTILFEGYKVSKDSSEVYWTVWGLGEEEDIKAGIQLPTTAQQP
ncbi:MAG: hypothetical protein AAFQ98_10255 [Bacteroidota bacterium]